MSGLLFAFMCVGKPAPPMPEIPASAIFSTISWLDNKFKSGHTSLLIQVSKPSTLRNIHN